MAEEVEEENTKADGYGDCAQYLLRGLGENLDDLSPLRRALVHTGMLFHEEETHSESGCS